MHECAATPSAAGEGTEQLTRSRWSPGRGRSDGATPARLSCHTQRPTRHPLTTILTTILAVTHFLVQTSATHSHSRSTISTRPQPLQQAIAMHSATSGRPNASSDAAAFKAPAPRSSQSVTLIRPAIWKSSDHATYSVSVQPCMVDGRQRVATASADKAQGVCIWDLAQMTSEKGEDAANADGVTVKLEHDSAAAHRPRGLLAVLPHHLSAVNVVRWEPVIGARLASGSDLPTQSIIIWKREAAGSKASDSTPFGLGHRSSSSSTAAAAGSSAAAASSDSVAIPNLETWVAHLSLLGPGDTTDLAWGPVGLHFRPSDDPFGLGASPSAVGCDMDAPAVVRRRIAAGLGSQVLASCSLDRSVVVWNTENGDRHHLKGHTGWVLGIAFDPQGLFLATQTIDGFVWLWSLANFQLIRKVRDVGLSMRSGTGGGPRADVGRTVSMARISFTADGAALVACRGELKRGGGSFHKPSSSSASLLASASKSTAHAPIKHVSVVLNRKRNFETQAVFGGHAGRTTVSAFSPVLFCADSGVPGAPPHFFSVLAVGSHDCTLSLWSTRRATPLLVLTELWSESILDASWSGDGRTLLVSSHDGSVVVLQFDLAVFEGRPATQQEQEERLRTLYGDAHDDAAGHAESDGAAAASSAMLASTHGLYESPALLALQAQQKAAQLRLRQVTEQEQQQKAQAESKKQAELARQQNAGAASSLAAAAAPSADATAAVAPTASILSRQTEVRRADGKRRIVPVSVAAPAADSAGSGFVPGAPIRSTSTSANAAASAATQLAYASPAMLMQLTGAVTGATDAADLFAGSAAAPQSKKRKHVDDDEQAASTKHTRPSTDAALTAPASSAAANSAASAAAAAPSGGSGLLAALGAPRAPPSDELILQPPPRSNRWLLTLPTPSAPASPFAPSAPISQCELQVTDFAGRPLRAEDASVYRHASLGTLLSAYAPAPSASSSSGAAAASTAAVAAAPSRHLVWQSFVQHRVLLAVGNAQILALACTDTVSGQFFLQLLSSASGRQLYPPLLLSAPPFLLSTRSSGRLGSLLVVTCDGLVRVYDLAPGAQGRRMRIQASVRSMLRAGGAHESSSKAGAASAATALKKKSTGKEDVLTITAARLNQDDAPVLVLSNQTSYVFDIGFESWALLSSPSPSFPGSEVRSELMRFQRTAAQEKEDEVCTLATAADGSVQQRGAAAAAAVPLSVLSSMDARTRVLHTVAQLESDLALRLHTGDAHAFRLALTAYVAKLVSFHPALPSAIIKLTEVCKELSGPPSAKGAHAAAASSSAVVGSGAGAQPPPRWQPFVWGLSKRSLLSSLMPLLHTNAHLHAFTIDLAGDLQSS